MKCVRDSEFIIFYIGLHPYTLSILDSNTLSVRYVNYLSFLSCISFNPFNNIFVVIYFLQRKKFNNFIIKKLLYALSLFRFFISGVYKKYLEYLNSIVEKNIEIVDIEDSSEMKEFFDVGIDLIVINSWSMLEDKIINMPKYGALNIHPSELPKYRGAIPTLWALKNKDDHSAVTYMLINRKMDQGNILRQEKFVIEPRDNWLSVEKKIDSIINKSLLNVVTDYLLDRIKPYEQKGESSTTGKYYKYRKIDWKEENSNDINNKVNLYPYIDPWTRCFVVFSDQEIELNSISKSHNNFCDQLKDLGAGYFYIDFYIIRVKTRDGEILEIRPFVDICFKSYLKILFNKRRFFD